MAKKKKEKKELIYIALVGGNYGEKKVRFEKDDKIKQSDLSDDAEKALLKMNAIKEVVG